MANKLIPTAGYVRVSHDEAAKHGFSIPAQKAGLQEYANKKGYIIVDWYIDEGKTARKKTAKRKEYLRLIEDAKQGKFEMIIFKCIDRWFRNIPEYYKTQDILESNNINWECSEEEYDTTTRDGRWKLHIYLMLAQDEADKSSERINYVFEHKIKNKEAITGSQPFGLKNEVIGDYIRVVKDKEVEHIVYDIFDQYELTHSKRKTLFYIQDKYDITFNACSFRKIFSNTLYYGHYKGVDDYVWNGSYLTKERFDKIQQINAKAVKAPPSKNEYIFTKLLRCSECNYTLNATFKNRPNKKYIYYRCRKHYDLHQCSAKSLLNEKIVEKHLLENLNTEIEKYIYSFSVEQTKKKPKPKISISEINEEIERLNYSYQKKRITLEKYDAEYEKLEEQLEKAKKEDTPVRTDFKALEEFLKSDWLEIYDTLTNVEKRSLFRSVIDHIVYDLKTKEYKIKFL